MSTPSAIGFFEIGLSPIEQTAASPNDAVITDTSSQIVDAAGNIWTINAAGQVAVNGNADTTTSNVAEIAYVNGSIWYETTGGIWFFKTSLNASWAPPNGTAFGPFSSTPPPPPLPPSPPPSPTTSIIPGYFSSSSYFDYQKTIISQYATSASLVTLIGAANQWLNPAANFANFFSTIWNVDTAQGIGLDIWGRIVGVTRILQISTSQYFGFEEAQLSAAPFNVAPFYTGQQVTNNYSLSDNAFRTLIFAKALANICDGSIPAINQLLLYLFPNRGNCYVVDNNNMSITYTFHFTLTPVEVAIVQQSGVLPKPTGVGVNFVITTI